MTPRFSIITPCLNAAPFITEAIESVLYQQADLEHIIVDGGSSDDTLSILQNYNHLLLITEPDNGMYDAINKGLSHARGEFVGLLNADDIYMPGAFLAAQEAFSAVPQATVIAGAFYVFVDAAQGRQVERISPAIEPDQFWFRIVSGSTAPNSWFFRREVFSSFGGFDTRFRYAADREFLMRLALAGVRPLALQQTFYAYRKHGNSATFSTLSSRSRGRGLFRIRLLEESASIMEEYLARSDLPTEMRLEVAHSNSEVNYRLAATALYHHQFAAAYRAIRNGLKRDALWLFKALGLAVHRLIS